MIRIHTLGGLTIRGIDGKPIVGAATQPRRLAIIALLARAGDRGVSRERILALLWPDADDERGPRALAQALYALRKDLGDDLIVGAKELRFDPLLVSTDVLEFSSAVSRGDDMQATALYNGLFLDGFHLPGADEFARWIERERAGLAHDYMRSLESLARTALVRGEPVESVNWWRKITALDPLNARFTMGLMDALFASGDRAGAIQQARIYQLLVEQELDLPPDRDVMALAERLRASTKAVPVRNEAAASPKPPDPSPAIIVESPPRDVPPMVAAVVDGVAPEPTEQRPPIAHRPTVSRNTLIVLSLVAASLVVLVATRTMSASRGAAIGDVAQAGTNANGPVVAVGQITSYGADSGAKSLAGAVADLLATSLARAPGLRVVSRGRLLELMRPTSGTGASDTSAGAFVNAARRAGGTEVIEGTVYTRPNGMLRLDLRRLDLATGAIGDVNTVEGVDLFALVDRGTAQMIAALGTRGLPSGSVADVTTRSVAAYRMYEQGVRAFFRGDQRTASAFFDGAIAEDSTFALANYYGARTTTTPESVMVRFERAKRFASRAPDRERLTILAGWANAVSSPALQQVAETLATRYPAEIEGFLYTGIARVYGGDFIGGVAPLERVLTMDSLGARGGRASCPSCEALQWLVAAYALADSLSAAEREARRWVRLQPGATSATNALVAAFEAEGRGAQADSVFRSTVPADPSYDDVLAFRAMHLVRYGDYDTADRLLLAKTKDAVPSQQIEAFWQLAISLREQGKLTEALGVAQRLRPLSVTVYGRPLASSVIEAQIDLESQRPAVAAALFDSIARVIDRTSLPSQTARATAWMLTHAANARAAAGDTLDLARLVDSVRALGDGSGYGRDRRLFHHVRGLLLTARHDDAGAISEFRAAIYSLPGGYTRTNYELGRLLLRNNRAREAIAILQPAFHGSLDASNLYVSRTELHELLAKAWDAAGAKDSAAAHYAAVASVWAAGDPPLRARADSARRRLASLGTH